MTTSDSTTGTVLLVETTSNNKIVTITLNRPKSLNALNLELLTALVEALKTHHNYARAIVLQGSGERAFCAGEDLKETLAPKTRSAAEYAEAFELLQDVTRLMTSSSAVFIVAVEGYAIGGGAEIALSGDWIVGSPSTKFQFPEVKLGHAVTGAISQRLAATVGVLRAKEMFLSGRMIGSEEALKIGMLTEYSETPKSRARDVAEEIVGTPGIAAGALKLQVESACFPGQQLVMKNEVETANRCYAAVDAQESYKKFEARSRARRLDPLSDIDDVKTIDQAFERALDRWPDNAFLRIDGNDVTFADFNERIIAVATVLSEADDPISSGDRVLTMMKNSMEAVVVWFAINRIGAIYVPLNTSFRSKTLINAIKLAKPKAAFADADLFEFVNNTGIITQSQIIVNDIGSQSTVPVLNGIRKLSSIKHDQKSRSGKIHILESSTAALLYTSGTTGRSKACILSHGYFIYIARSLIQGYGLNQSDVLFCPFPLYHIDSTSLTIIPALLLGATAAIGRKFSVSNFWNELRQTRATVYDFMGTTLSLVYKAAPNEGDRDHNVRLAWGVPVPSWANDYETRFGHKIVELYGSTEAGLPIMQQGDRVSGSCGRLMDGYELKIVELDDSKSGVGEILLRPKGKHQIFDGYFENPEANSASITKDGWFKTGDVGSFKDGNLYFKGRMVDCIRRKGENISAMEVEEEIGAYEVVREVAALGIPSELGEEDLKVFVVVKDGCDEEKVWKWCVEHLSRVHVPDVVEIVAEIRRTPTGKILKCALEKSGGKRFDSRQSRTG